MAKKKTTVARKKKVVAKKKRSPAPRKKASVAGEIRAPIENECPTKLNVKEKMRSLLEGEHTTPETAMKMLDLLLGVIALYAPPLTVFCEGFVASHVENLLDENGPFRVTGRGRVYYVGTMDP